MCRSSRKSQKRISVEVEKKTVHAVFDLFVVTAGAFLSDANATGREGLFGEPSPNLNPISFEILHGAFSLPAIVRA